MSHAARATARPVADPPVRPTAAIRWWVTSRCATSTSSVSDEPRAASSGTPAASISSHSRTAIRDVVGAGFQTNGEAVASAGPRYSIGMLNGKFHGVSSAHAPSGCRITLHALVRVGDRRHQPSSRSASAAASRKPRAPAATSSAASARGLPCSSASARRARRPPRRSVGRPRGTSRRARRAACGGPARTAAPAASAARSRPPAVARAACASSAPVAGLRDLVARRRTSVQAPATKLRRVSVMRPYPGRGQRGDHLGAALPRRPRTRARPELRGGAARGADDRRAGRSRRTAATSTRARGAQRCGSGQAGALGVGRDRVPAHGRRPQMQHQRRLQRARVADLVVGELREVRRGSGRSRRRRSRGRPAAPSSTSATSSAARLPPWPLRRARHRTVAGERGADVAHERDERRRAQRTRPGEPERGATSSRRAAARRRRPGRSAPRRRARRRGRSTRRRRAAGAARAARPRRSGARARRPAPRPPGSSPRPRAPATGRTRRRRHAATVVVARVRATRIPASVDERDDDDRALVQVDARRVDAEHAQRVGDERDDQRADQHAADGAAPAEDRRAADHRGRDGVEQQAGPADVGRDDRRAAHDRAPRRAARAARRRRR